MMRSTTLALISCVVLGNVACDKLPNIASPTTLTKPLAPTVTLGSVTLVAAPSNEQLAKFYCPDVAGALICRALGGRPAEADLRFSFTVELQVTNPNAMPVPAVEALVAFKAFPSAAQASSLGTVCLALCEEGAECGPPAGDACSSTEGVLKSRSDYATAAVGFLVSTALGKTAVADLAFRTIPAGGTIVVKTQLDIGVVQMLALLRLVAGDAMAQVKRGTVPSFAIPFELEGSVWLKVESFGKIGASFGPHQETWQLR